MSSPNPPERNDVLLKILLVEDNEADMKIALRAFKQAKLQNQLFVVRDGQECVEFVRHEGAFQDVQQFPRPDLILMDINMPRLNGFDALKILKGDAQYSTIPVIMFSASKNEEDVQKSLQYGANSFMQKPVIYEEFVQLIEGFNYYWHMINKLPHRN